MSKINKQALREAAEKANPEQYGYYLIDAFTDLATPATVLALLDELEAAEKRNTELERGDKVIKCWSCQKSVTVSQVTAEDGYCPSCNCGIDIEDYETAELVAAGIITRIED